MSHFFSFVQKFDCKADEKKTKIMYSCKMANKKVQSEMNKKTNELYTYKLIEHVKHIHSNWSDYSL